MHHESRLLPACGWKGGGLQGFSCGEVRLKFWMKSWSSKWVRLDVEYSILLSSPHIHPMEA